MGLILIAIFSMFFFLGLGYIIVYGCLFIIWLISLFFGRDERRRQHEEMERQNKKTEQMIAEIQAQNEVMRQRIDELKIINQKKREEIARRQREE